LQEEGTLGAIMDLEDLSISEEQHTGSEDSRFDCFNYHATLQVGVVAVTTTLKLF
jgi:hypothetical protein